MKIGNPGAHDRPDVLPEFDATPLIGLRVTVCDAATIEVDEDGEKVISVPNLRGLQAASAVARCLRPIKLRGWEIRAIRKVMRLTLAGLADMLDSKTAPETISRWESEAQPMGGFAEKVLRLLVCETLHKEAPGISYDGSMIAELRVKDPWLVDRTFEVPYLQFHTIRLKKEQGSIVDAWDAKKAA